MSREPAPVRIGIVGSGSMAEYHVKKFNALPGVAVTACADRSLGHARAFAERLGIPKWFPSTADLAGSAEVEAEGMLTSARAAGVPALVNFSKRNAPLVALARRLVAEGRLGTVCGASFSYLQSWLLQDAWGRWDVTPRWRRRVAASTSTGGVIGDLGSHLIDLVRFILG